MGSLTSLYVPLVPFIPNDSTTFYLSFIIQSVCVSICVCVSVLEGWKVVVENVAALLYDWDPRENPRDCVIC